MPLFFIPLERIRSESLREKCLFSVATLRPALVESRLTRFPRRVSICFDGKLGGLRIHPSREICKLTDVCRILEQNHVVGIETHGSRKLVFRKQVLGEEDDADVSVMRTFRKHVGDRLVGLLHEILDNHQRRFFTVKVLDIRKTLVKFRVGILVEELLVFSVEVNSLCGWRRYQRLRIVDQSKHETSLSTARWTGHDGGKRMDER